MRAMFPWSCRICKLVSLYLSISLSFLDASFAHFAGRRTFQKPIQKNKRYTAQISRDNQTRSLYPFPIRKTWFWLIRWIFCYFVHVCTCGYYKPPQALFHSFELACNQYLIIKVVKFYSKYLHIPSFPIHEWESIVWIEHQHLIFWLDIQFWGILRKL